MGRKIPWINIYTEGSQEKEQEMIGSVGPGDSTSKITLSEFSSSKELMEKELEARSNSKSRPVCTGRVLYTSLTGFLLIWGAQVVDNKYTSQKYSEI